MQLSAASKHRKQRTDRREARREGRTEYNKGERSAASQGDTKERKKEKPAPTGGVKSAALKRAKAMSDEGGGRAAKRTAGGN